MNELIYTGKKKTILISISILLVSIHTIYSYQATRPEIDTGKLAQQIVRFILTVLLVYYTYKGKKWARNLSIILFTIALIVAISALVTLDTNLVAKTPLITMILVYSISIYHFGLSKSYKAFFDYQNGTDTLTETDE